MDSLEIKMTAEENVAMTLAIAATLDAMFPDKNILEIIAKSAEVIYGEISQNTGQPSGTGENVEQFSHRTEAGESPTSENL